MASKSLVALFALLLLQFFAPSLGSSRTIPINVSCGQVSNYKWLNLVKPSGGQTCYYTIKPFNSYVCQLKVDFSTNLPSPIASAPGQAPICPSTGYIEIGRFRICGVSSNQHLYIPFSGSNLQNTLTITTNAGGGTYQIGVTQVVCPPAKNRSIKELTEEAQKQSDVKPQEQVEAQPSADQQSQNEAEAQLPAEEVITAQDAAGAPQTFDTRTFDTDLMAPTGCDQYFSQLSGSLESFNWNNGQGPYPGNLRYTVCFRKPSSSMRLQLFAQDFDLESNDLVAQTGTNCYDESMPGFANDYIFIPVSKILETGVSSDYYCGISLKGKTLETSMFGLYWFTFNAGQNLGISPAKRLYKFYYNIY